MIFMITDNYRSVNFFPPAADRAEWQKVCRQERFKNNALKLIDEALQIIEQPVPALPAQIFMQFRLEGDRLNYEKLYFKRRCNLKKLVLAECIEYRGRFLGKIFDYLWEITSEHFWDLPAHVPEKVDPLPYARPERIALFSSTTGIDLVMVLNLLEEEIAKISPNMVRIIKRELDERIVEPLEIRPFPFDFITKTNNWRPWCIRNSTAVMMFRLYDQPERLQQTLDFFKASMREYIANYAADGCCDEGPGYWGLNPVMVMHFYDLIKEKPDDFAKFTLMADYIIHAQLTEKYFANFADAPSQPVLPWGACYRYGEFTGNKDLQRLAASAESTVINERAQSLYDDLCDLFYLAEVPIEPYIPPENSFKYYDRLQMLFLKDRDIAIAAKRGFQGSPYHMDIGQFILFYQQKPIIIDLGAAVYTAETFSGHRFRNWILNSEGHNIPQFNNIAQLELPKPDANAAVVERTNEKCVFKLDLLNAYPAEAELEKCERIITYDYRDQSLEVEDKWQLKRDNNSIKIPLYTPQRVASQAGSYRIGNTLLSVSGSAVQTALESLVMTDAKVIANWGENINKITITTSSGKTGSCKMRFNP